jgi:hypothetical protein
MDGFFGPDAMQYLSKPSNYTAGTVLLDDSDLRVVHVEDPTGGGFNVEVFVKEGGDRHRQFPLVVQWYNDKPQCFVWTHLDGRDKLDGMVERFPYEVESMPDGSRRVRILHWYY